MTLSTHLEGTATEGGGLARGLPMTIFGVVFGLVIWIAAAPARS